MIIEISQKELMRKEVVFQKKGYMGWNIWKYITEHKDALPAEIFPAIFISIRKESGHWKKTRILAKKHCRDNTVVFHIMNVRDRFEIVDPLSERSLGNGAFGEIITKIETISPDSLPYPDNLGGGFCGGCPVVSYFDRILYSDEYQIIDDASVVEQTRSIPFFDNLCKSSKCYRTYQSIINNGYQLDLQKDQLIEIEVSNGKYIPQEGKHRICALKRYDYTGRIPAKITYSSWHIDREFYFSVQYTPTDSSINEYYKCYESYGLSKTDVLDYLTDQNKSLCKMIMEKQGISEGAIE